MILIFNALMTSPYDVTDFEIIANVLDQTFWVQDITYIFCLAVIQMTKYVLQSYYTFLISIFSLHVLYEYMDNDDKCTQWKLANVWIVSDKQITCLNCDVIVTSQAPLSVFCKGYLFFAARRCASLNLLIIIIIMESLFPILAFSCMIVVVFS